MGILEKDVDSNRKLMRSRESMVSYHWSLVQKKNACNEVFNIC